MSVGKYKIVVVDNNIEFRDMVCEYLDSQEDFEVAGTAADGLEALELIKTIMPDIVVLDIIMPVLDGIGVLEKCKSDKTIIRPLFVMVSAAGGSTMIKRAFELGADYYFVKPINMNFFVAAVRKLISGR